MPSLIFDLADPAKPRLDGAIDVGETCDGQVIPASCEDFGFDAGTPFDMAAWLSRNNSGRGSAVWASGSALNSSSVANLAFSRAWATAVRTSSADGSAAYAYPSRPPAITRTPTPRDSANVRPSTSPRRAVTSVRLDSSA